MSQLFRKRNFQFCHDVNYLCLNVYSGIKESWIASLKQSSGSKIRTRSKYTLQLVYCTMPVLQSELFVYLQQSPFCPLDDALSSEQRETESRVNILFRHHQLNNATAEAVQYIKIRP